MRILTIVRMVRMVCWLCSALLLVPAGTSFAVDRAKVQAIETLGLERTRRSWLLQYLELPKPPFAAPSAKELKRLSQKLTTTEVFSSAEVRLAPGRQGFYRMVIEVAEKWTTIPVIRGAYGGGTPLQVIGIYDTHGFGRLHTYGVESRRYGDAKPGWVAWFRAPRWGNGAYTLGVELWQEERIRDLYDGAQQRVGQYKTSAQKLRLLYERPVGFGEHHKLGLDLWWEKLGSESFTLKGDTTSYLGSDALGSGVQKVTDPEVVKALVGIRPMDENATLANLALRYVYDDAVKDHFDIDGTRAIGLWGFIKNDSQLYNYFQGEVFHYVNLRPGTVIAGHAKGRWSDSDSYLTQLFLGGFDSVRGYKDGFKYGAKAGYLNLEYRRILAKKPYIHVQGLGFIDAGYAGKLADSSDEQPLLTSPSGSMASVGVGVRVSYPKVNRLIVRFDVAKPIGASGTGSTKEELGIGIAVGLNQFFQPHKPL